MEHYVTLLDGGFLPQGLALRASLQRVAQPFTLWVLCVDDQAADTLERLSLGNIRILRLSVLETAELKAVKATRNRGEYCWTLTPFAPRFVFEAAPDVSRVTYVDADLWFMQSPQPLFKEFELSGKAVMITEHAYHPDYDQSARTGRYCVQFLIFVRDQSEPVRSWWEERCLEWCYDRIEDGKFGDQKYLDDWPRRFAEKVHVLMQVDAILAPWNAARFPYGQALIYHFHRLRLVGNRRVVLSRGYDIPQATQLALYKPYVAELARAVTLLESAGHNVLPQGNRPGAWIALGVIFRKLQRLLSRIWPVMTDHLPVHDASSSDGLTK